MFFHVSDKIIAWDFSFPSGVGTGHMDESNIGGNVEIDLVLSVFSHEKICNRVCLYGRTRAQDSNLISEVHNESSQHHGTQTASVHLS